MEVMSDGIMKSARSPVAATSLAIISRYGTGLLLGVLSLLGVLVALNEKAWGGAISALALLAATLMVVSSWRRSIVYPAIVAVIGVVLILWTMYGAYSRMIELIGFAVLIAATAMDWRVRSTSLPGATEQASWIDVAELGGRLGQKPMPVVLDVRGADEFTGELGHIAGARNISLGELPGRMDEIEPYRDCTIVLVCKTQVRSARAAALLKERGFRHASVLRGGMLAWVRQHGSSQAK
jgi:rhodanese-related sulfurtransferase/energy-converting hydrogenase Eha subunit A